MTLQQHIEHIKRVSEDLLRAERPVVLAAGSAIAEFSERVFVDGRASTGGQFQYNSTSPLYVNPAKTFGNTSGLKPPRGKNGNTEFRSGKKHKTTWVESYKALRGLVGRPNTFVNWTATGDLKSEIENRSLIRVGDLDYKFRVNSEENSGKLSGLIKKYTGVFRLSDAEKQTYYKAFEFEFRKLLSESLR